MLRDKTWLRPVVGQGCRDVEHARPIGTYWQAVAGIERNMAISGTGYLFSSVAVTSVNIVSVLQGQCLL